MNNKELLETTKEIVIAMVNSKLITANSKSEINTSINETIESIYNKLVELNKTTIVIGNCTYNE